MRVTVQRTVLSALLSAVTKVVENRTTYPILANVLLTFNDGTLTARGTDLDIEITSKCEATGENGTTTVPARALGDIVKKVSGEEVTLELDGDALTVKSGRSRFKLTVMGADGFPDMSTGEFGPALDIDLAGLFAPVKFAISTEETRYYLNGIFLHTSGDRLRAVATDGHRLAAQFGPEHQMSAPVIVPRKTVGIIPQGVVSVSFSDTKMRIVAGDIVVVSKLIEGNFPDYERVIPKENDKLLSADRAALIGAVERVGIMSSDRGGKAVKLDLASGSVTLSVRGEGGEATEETAADYESEPMTIGFNADYLAGMLRVVTGERVSVAVRDSGGPSLITGDSDDWLAVLMPMRVV
jgi:DNA polymerase III subunit beta